MGDCIFCAIAKGEIPAAKILDEENFMAFLDLNPVHKGHTLLIPRFHCATLADLSPRLGEEFLSALQKTAAAVLEATGASGFNVMQNNGAAAGQEVMHLHWHIIPRFDNDGLRHWPQSKYASPDEMQAMASAIRAKLNG